MPGLNFDYTKFLRQQHEKYIKKYGDEPIKADPNPQPMIGFSGHVPTYRGSLHEQRVVRSLVRCISSPMKPTTATGYRSKSKQFYNPDDTCSPRPSSSRQSGTNHQTDNNAKSTAALARENHGDEPKPSDISMMASGSSDLLKESKSKSASRSVKVQHPHSNGKLSSRSSARSTASSLVPLKVHEPLPVSKRPAGYPQTLYGSSFWYAWPGDTPRPKDSRGARRPDSYDVDRRLNNKDGVLYHKHEGMVPKYLGYVPGYKFRHGSTFGVLTVNSTSHGITHRILAKS